MPKGTAKAKIGIRSVDGTDINPATEDKQDDIITALGFVAGFRIPAYDYLSFIYTSGNLTGIIYKSGSSGGATVATLTLAYNSDNELTSITKT